MTGLSSVLFAGLASSLLVLSVSPASARDVALYAFCSRAPNCADGADPEGGLTDLGGTLYGTTRGGGSNGFGTVFSFNSETGTETVVYSFCSRGSCADGASPRGALIEANGLLYGTTMDGGGTGCGGYGCGTVYVLDPATGAETVLHAFAGGKDGANPYAAVVDVKGTLYGTTSAGAGSGCYQSLGCGTVFSLDPATGKEKVLHSFTAGTDGANPYGALLEVNGLLYGTTSAGAGSGCFDGGGCGVLFSLDPRSDTETVLHAFGTGTDGQEPMAGLVDLNGILYSSTYEGGAHALGSVFSFDPGTGAEQVVWSFYADFPETGPVAVKGILYGTTNSGGGHALGSVYSFDPATGVENQVYGFRRASGGAPNDLLAVKGRLYGTTWDAGPNNAGTVFSVRR